MEMTYREPTDWVKKRRVQLLSLVQLSPDLCPPKKSEFLHPKKKLKENAIYKSAFITDDLMPLRAKLLKLLKKPLLWIATLTWWGGLSFQ